MYREWFLNTQTLLVIVDSVALWGFYFLFNFFFIRKNAGKSIFLRKIKRVFRNVARP